MRGPLSDCDRVGINVVEPSSDAGVTSARTVHRPFMSALARMPLDSIAEAIGKDESVASRVRSGEARLTVAEMCALIASAGLKVVSVDQVCVKRDKLGAMTTLLAAAFSDEMTTQRLVWDDAQ